MGAMDQGFKAWLDLCKEDVLPWVLGEPATFLGMYPKELAPAPQLLPDSFLRAGLQKQECLVNVEVQAAIDSNMGRRMYEYGSRASLDSGLSVFSVVLWLFKDRHGRRPPASPYRMYVGKHLRATWEFNNIELYRLPPDAIMNAGAVGLLPLLPFTQNASTDMIETAMRRVKDEAPAEQVTPLAGRLSLFTSRFYGKDRALEMFRRLFMSTEILQEFPLFRWMMAEAEAKGEARGERELLRRVLERRFGTLSEDMQQAINLADADALTDLALAAGTESLEQLRARLGLGGNEAEDE